MNTKEDIWIKVKDLLRIQLTSTAVDTWFDDSELVSLADDKVIICSPYELKRDVIKKRYVQNIRAALKEIFAFDFEVSIIGEEEKFSFAVQKNAQPNVIHDDYTFENYIVGNSNTVAHAAAEAVAEHADSPIIAYNPLFIYGDSGLGKTHLLYAIANAVKKKFPQFRIVYMKGDEFTNDLIKAIKSGKNAEFRNKYRGADLFLMDDIQFIAGKDSTQEEFFHTFNSLYESRKQIVLTSDRPPDDMPKLENRLKTRFEGGLMTEINPPDFEMRSAIIKKKSELLGLYLNDKQVNYISDNITSNVRQLEGAVKKIYAYIQLGDKDMAGNAIARAVDEMRNDKGEEIPSPDLIMSEVSRYYSVTQAELAGKVRTAELALARQIVMYLMKAMTNMSYNDIGKTLKKDHSTVMHGEAKIARMVATDANLKNTVEEITENIKARL